MKIRLYHVCMISMPCSSIFEALSEERPIEVVDTANSPLDQVALTARALRVQGAHPDDRDVVAATYNRAAFAVREVSETMGDPAYLLAYGDSIHTTILSDG